MAIGRRLDPALALAGLGLFLVVPPFLPQWITFLLTLAWAKALAVLGIVLLLRGGLLTFGHALYYAVGAYTAGFAVKFLGVHEGLVVLGLAVVTGAAASALLGLLLARYRGVLAGFSVGHIVPELSFWTQSGEFVFVALLGGTGSVLAPVAGSIVFEFVRNYAFKYSPYTWQMTLGIVLLGIIFFLPGGLWSLKGIVARRWTIVTRRSQ